MSTVIFKLSEPQEAELKAMMERENFTNKSAFFRFLMKFYTFHSTRLSIPQKAEPEVSVASQPTPDENLSEETQKMLANPYLFDEEVRQLVREMDPLYSHTPLYIEKRGA